jgi:hypothetical protein
MLKKWGKGFGIMKKILDLTIATDRSEKLYKLHMQLVNEMKTHLSAETQPVKQKRQFC